MDKKIPLTHKTVETMRYIRSNSEKLSWKDRKLADIEACIRDDIAKISTIVRERKDVETEEELQERQGRITQIGLHLDGLEEMRDQLKREISDHKLDLLGAREYLEKELFHVLRETGQLHVTDCSSDVVSSIMEGVTYGQDQLLVEDREDLTGQIRVHIEKSCLSARSSGPEDGRIRKAMSLLGAAKEALRAANSDYHGFDEVYAAMRRDFEGRTIPEWHDMSRTEFDLEQLAQQIEVTRDLIKAERAYSEAGRFALEVGYVRV
jgi:hypothetical protein